MATVPDLPASGAWRSFTVGGAPILVVRDRDGELSAFLNLCRHRAMPLCEPDEEGAGAVIRCPYHAWIYRLDGTLAKAGGIGFPEGFDTADYSLKPVGLAQWRNCVFVDVSGSAGVFDLGPLAGAIDAWPIERMELVLVERHERAFNWKVLLENYSENYHTPFVHPEIDTSNSEDYPVVSDGRVLYAWDRPIDPADEAGRLMAELLPGEPGWSDLARTAPDRPYGVGSYLTIWPNAMLNVFPDSMLVMWMEPVAPNRTIVERRLFMAPTVSPEARQRIIDAHRVVHDQDVDICVRLQRSHDAGLDADGRLATVEERGVYFVHQWWRRTIGR